MQNGQVYVAGNTRNESLNAGTVTNPASGTGLNAFAATLSTGLAPSSSDAIAYYGGTGDTRATAMTVSGGDVWLTGTVTGDLPGEAAIGSQDGFVAALNPTSGAVDYAQRITGQDGRSAPTSIAVAPTGASVLDQLGLPEGVVDGPVSTLVTSNTSVKAGDSFQISANGETPVTITVKAKRHLSPRWPPRLPSRPASPPTSSPRPARTTPQRWRSSRPTLGPRSS